MQHRIISRMDIVCNHKQAFNLYRKRNLIYSRSIYTVQFDALNIRPNMPSCYDENMSKYAFMCILITWKIDIFQVYILHEKPKHFILSFVTLRHYHRISCLEEFETEHTEKCIYFLQQICKHVKRPSETIFPYNSQMNDLQKNFWIKQIDKIRKQGISLW